MDKKIIEYRKKHPRCRYCDYLEIKNYDWVGITLYRCLLKDLFLKNNSCNLQGCFCKNFKIRREDSEV